MLHDHSRDTPYTIARCVQVILGDNCHIYNYEGGGISALGGLAFHVIHNEPNGELPLEQLQAAVRPDDAHCSRSGLVCLESSHNRCGGTVLSLEYMEAVKHWADGQGMPVHLDGARVFNAAQALGVDVGTIAAHVTSIQFCLSKVHLSTHYTSPNQQCHIASQPLSPSCLMTQCSLSLASSSHRLAQQGWNLKAQVH